ncbi:hypothetical protein SETIT_7G125500v2 [Setaria italica]|uniref:Uncharacterized protein n=1 Tax=Setaria italica TaxID=4555 RepID=A0A368RUS4_SETIT|nr:hypothetical protein SETIT_7G125500v2 [Setaria italica]
MGVQGNPRPGAWSSGLFETSTTTAANYPHPRRVASAAPPDRRRRRYTCRCARSTAAAPPFENCAGATWPGGAPLLRTIFYSPKSHLLLLLSPTIPFSLYKSTRLRPPVRPRRIQIRARFSRAAARRLALLARASPFAGFHRSGMPNCPVVAGAAPLAAPTAHDMHVRSVASDRDYSRRAVASPFSFFPL